jgi:cytochrome c peroxidase
MRRQLASHPDLRPTRTQTACPAYHVHSCGDDGPVRMLRGPSASECVAPKNTLQRVSALLGTRTLIVASVAAAPFALWSPGVHALEPIESLGKNVFFDTSLSTPGNKQGCVSCHEPTRGGVFPDAAVNAKTVVAPGAAPHRFGSLKPPSNIYALSPSFRTAFGFGLGFPSWGGGTFWNGRAEGCGAIVGAICPVPLPAQRGAQISETVTRDDLPESRRNEYAEFLGPLADQALNPFPKGVEQNAGEKKVCQQVKTAKYKELYDEAYGEPIDCRDPAVHTSFKRIAVALAAWQRSKDVNRFDSKRDRALADDADHKFPFDDNDGGVRFTDQENWGHDLFYGVTSKLNPGGKNAQCSSCHNGLPDKVQILPGPPEDRDGTNPNQLYTDHRYHNIGVPFNPEIPGVAEGEKKGLFDHVVASASGNVAPGFFKTPPLRNVAKGAEGGFIKAYAHNGWFKSLESIVHFYNTRDVLNVLGKCDEVIPLIPHPTEAQARENHCWPKAEFEANKRGAPAIGNLGLTDDEEAGIVAYLKTLSDLSTPSRP